MKNLTAESREVTVEERSGMSQDTATPCVESRSVVNDDGPGESIVKSAVLSIDEGESET